jgi:hypothetical protein
MYSPGARSIRFDLKDMSKLGIHWAIQLNYILVNIEKYAVVAILSMKTEH